MDKRCIIGLDSVGDEVRTCVLTIGNFDGVHLGHQRILQAARGLADLDGSPVVAMTFDPPPAIVLKPDGAPLGITPTEKKVELLLENGCDFVVIVKTTKAVLAIEPDKFVEDVMVSRFAPRHIVEGSGFLFGRKLLGDLDMLRRMGQGLFEVHEVANLQMELPTGRAKVSSTLIRLLVEGGHVDQAAMCLSRNFALYGKVTTGTGRGGKLLGFPTINLEIPRQVIPADGVYAGRANVENSQYAAAVSVGYNPTLGGTSRTVEAFLLDAEGDFLEADATLEFIQRIGDQEKFENTEELSRQIAKDVQRVREIIG